MAIKGGRPESRQIAPHLIVRGCEAAVEFYKRAFGAEELYRSEMRAGSAFTPNCVSRTRSCWCPTRICNGSRTCASALHKRWAVAASC